jgi:hypothetical protein
LGGIRGLCWARRFFQKSLNGYIGPLISGVAKSMQGNRLIYVKSPKKSSTKKRDHGELELPVEIYSRLIEEPRTKRNSKGETKDLESVAKGRIGSLEITKNGSGMVEAKMQPR